MRPSQTLTVFVDHHASGPSGITTYGAHLAATLPGLHRVNLHALASASSSEACTNVPADRSHDPGVLADVLVALADRYPARRTVWLPNVGDVSWAGVWRALSRMSACDRERIRVFGVVHGDQESQFEAMRRYAPIVAGMAGVSRRCVSTLAARLGPDAPPVEHLEYPVTLAERVSSMHDDGPLRILYAGRFEESQKRISRLPELIRQLAAVGVPFRARLAGDGPGRAFIEQQIASMPVAVSSCVEVLGHVPHDDISGLLMDHDLLILVSAFEGTPLVLLEAMAAGVCPMLMRLAGDLSELLEDGRNACVVPQGDVGAMVAAIQALHQDRRRLAALKAAARGTIERRADPVRHAAWLQRRLATLWERPAPDPALVADPDPLGQRIDRVVQAVLAAHTSRVAVWGGGVVGRQIVDRLLASRIVPVAVVDTDTVRHGEYRGVTVSDPAALEACRPQIVCVGSVAFADEIVAALRQRGCLSRVLVP